MNERVRTAGWGVAAALAVSPLLGAGAAAGAPLGPPGLTSADTACDSTVTRYIDQTPSALTRLSASRSWELATGRRVVVAVVGSGVNSRNAHLEHALLPGTDFVPPPQDQRLGQLTAKQKRALHEQQQLAAKGWWDESGHGTAVAGEIAARRVDRSGVVGLAPAVKILPVRVYATDDGSPSDDGRGPDVGRIAKGIRYAADHDADVINVSMSSTIDDPALRSAVKHAAREHALVVASAGNRDTSQDKTDSPRYPAAYPGVLAVTATDDADAVTPDSIHGPHVDVAAPGTAVLTTFWAAGDCLLSEAEQSTSYATAYVSGAAALVAQRFPQESPARWRYRLEATAARPDRASRDDQIGWGVVQPYAALTVVVDGTAPGPVAPSHSAPAEAVPAPLRLDLGERSDAHEPTRAAALWWSLGGLTLLLGLGLAARLARLRHRPTPQPDRP